MIEDRGGRVMEARGRGGGKKVDQRVVGRTILEIIANDHHTLSFIDGG